MTTLTLKAAFLKSRRALGLGLIFISASALAQPSVTLNLMPVPAEMTLKDGKLRLARDFSISFSGNASPRVSGGATRFLRRLDGRTGLFFDQGIPGADNSNARATLLIESGKSSQVVLGEDEAYSLDIGATQIRLTAASDLGALHGLETLLQLLMADEQGYYFPQISIHDKPRFPWRGLMIDVARHFLPVDVIKRNIDGMAAVKLNVLHLHLTDNQGFRIESKAFPKLHQLSNGEYFTQAEIRQIVAYAGERGVRVVPEFDLPAHATAWLAAYPKLASRAGTYALERKFGIFDPVLDPTREENYQFLDKLFAELLPLFPDPYVHIGGDENEKGIDWNENPSIQAFMRAHNLADNHALQAHFNQRILKIFARMNRKMIGWEEILHPDLPKTAVVHAWLGKASLLRAAKLGYSTLMSEGFYIDLMHPASQHYLNDPILPEGKDLAPSDRQRILGGEATMWSELVTAQNVDSRIWPRTAAIAERLWSPANVRDVEDMYRRLDSTSVRLEELGLTHITSRQVLMRNLAGGTTNTGALEVLLDVVEPMKDYKRNADNIYSVTSPFTLFADAANSDARAARLFRNAMDRFLASGRTEDREYLRNKLMLWRDNHAGILALIGVSPNLKEVAELSANLKAISEIALTLLDSPGGMTAERYRLAKLSVKLALQQGGRTELQVVVPIEKLIERRLKEGER